MSGSERTECTGCRGDVPGRWLRSYLFRPLKLDYNFVEEVIKQVNPEYAS